MKKYFKSIFTLLSLIILSLVLWYSYHNNEKNRLFDPQDVILNSANNQVYQLKDFRNGITLIYFGFLTCPEACPTTLSKFKKVFEQLTPLELEKITFLFVTLDNQRDDIFKMQEYVKYFHNKFIPIKIKEDHLKLFTRFYGISYIKVPLKNSKMGYTIDHSTYVIPLDKRAAILNPISHDAPVTEIIINLKKYIEMNK